MYTRFFFPILFFLLFAQQYLHAQQWQRVTGLPAGEMPVLLVRGDSFFVAGQNKLYYSYDTGNTWDSTIVIHPSVEYISAIYQGENRLYVATSIVGVWSSPDGGQTWINDSNGLSGAGANAVSSLTDRGDSLYAGTYGSGVFVKKISTNSAWSAYNLGMPWGNIESLNNMNGTLLAGSGANGTVSLQTSPGHTWTEIPFDVFNGAENFFLGVVRQGDVWLAAGTRRLYRSTDQGATWTSFNPGTGFLELARFAVSGQRVYAQLVKPTGLAFIRYTDDNGLTWNNFEPSLTGSAGYDIAVCNGWLYSARGNGLWRIALTTPTREPGVELPGLAQNFPNPFSSRTTIVFTLPQQTKIDLSVFDAAGTHIRTIWQGEQPAGEHRFEFDAVDLPAGMYICRIACDKGVVARSMVLKK